jgi:uncharacterized phage protein gp47/JayE
MSFGITATGFNRKRLADIQTELEAALQLEFGDDIDLDPSGPFGQIIGIMAEREAELWELAEDTYNSAFPDTAAGVPLDNAVALTGHSRLPATYSTVTATLATSGGSPVVVPAGSRVKVAATGATFALLEDATIPASSNVAADFEATVTGPLEAPIGTLTTIVDPISGWTSVTNAAEAVAGRDEETDAELRLRRLDELSTAQGGTIAAMEARIPELVTAVTFCAVEENRTDATVGDLTPHSIHVVVVGGADADVAQAIWDTKPAGAETIGDESATVVDSMGNNQTIYFDRATTVRMYLIANLTTTADYPATGDTLVTDALAAFDDDLEAGDDVLNWKLVAALNDIPGITAVEILQGTSAPPTLSNNTTITASQVATIAGADITVNS